MNNAHMDLGTVIQIRDEAIDLLAKSVWGLKYPYLIADLKMVPFNLNPRQRTVGGTCGWSRNQLTGVISKVFIDINHEYATKLATREQLTNTVKHELAHAFQVLKSGYTKHDLEWKLIHGAMGGNQQRCHAVEVRKNKVKRHMIKDLATGKVYRAVSTRNWNRIKSCRFFDPTQGKFVEGYALLASYFKGDPVPQIA